MALGANAAPVPFDFGAAESLITACRTAASSIDAQVGQRWSLVSTGSKEFKGLFSQLFAGNALTAAADATELSMSLRDMADKAQQLADQARAEQERRDKAKAWQEEHDNRSGAQKVWDDLFNSGDDPPFGDPVEPGPLSVPAPPNRPRDPMAPAGGSGQGGSGGGTSSAMPKNLHAFASGSSDLNGQLEPVPGRVSNAYDTFCMRCKWGSLDANGPINGFRQWLAANAMDVEWATVVANAFKAAGANGEVSTLSNSAVAAALQAHHVNITRNDLTIQPPQAYGAPPTSGYADDPVNTATGNFLEVEADLTFPGAASMLTLGRTYNSFDAEIHAFGVGWSSICEAGLTLADDLARFTLPDGRQIHFPRLGDGWDRAAGESLWLSRDANSGELVVTGNDGSWWRLSSGGTLRSFGTGPAEARAFVTLVRDEAGRLLRLSHARGQWIDLDWTDERVVSARSADGRTVTYAYDADVHLLSAAGPTGTRTYRWGADGRIAAVVDADGVVEVDNLYDDRGRVTTQRSPFGRTTRYVYLPGRTTVVSDEDGTRSNTWLHDEKGRLIGVVDADEQRQSTSYDRWSNPVVLTERDGSTTVHECDARGRRVRSVTPSGADLTFGYDDLDRVTTVVTEQGAVTAYTYDGDLRNPSTIVDPEGRLTCLTWTDGLLTEIVDPTDVVVRLTYDLHGDLVGTTNADGHTARLERDDLGRVTAAITPSGQLTTYIYDPSSGLLAERVNPDGGTWRYEYTAGGRLASTVDPLGSRTSLEYGPHGEEAATIDPLGRAVTRRLDDLGNLAAVELPDGARWEFAHDALSRLVATTDPTGGVWRQEFDRAGNPVASVDATGVRVGVDLDAARNEVEVRDGDVSTHTGFDPLGRLTSIGQADGSSAVYTYDRCGRPVEALDADGGLTLIRRDAAGRPLEVVSPLGATTRYAYDHCGRLVSVTDPNGAVTTIGYDVDSRPVTQTLPTGEVARSTYDVCGRIVEHHAPGVGTSRWTYDLAGQVVEWQDSLGGTRRFRYDAAGQLVAAIDGNGGVTTYDYDANGRTTRITDPLGGVTVREFDAMNRCVAETDPIGRTTRAGYDAAGRQVWQESPDGRRTTWTFDASGRPATMAVDGRTVTALTRDLRRRTVRTVDSTREDGVVVEHELEWNRRGQLVRRTRDGRSVEWTYDADGRRTSMVTPDGTTTSYGYDRAGHLTSIDSSVLGRAAFDHDAAGRLISALAGGMIQSWEHRDGFVVGHTITDSEGSTRTTIDRDDDGRITRVVKGDGSVTTATDYAYDGAHQLVEARIRTTSGTSTISSTNRWRYDAAGRMVAESTDQAALLHVYDAAGQLLTSNDAGGREVRYTYDGAGRRTGERDNRGQAREFVWNPSGYLAGVVHHDRDRVRKTTVHADALGELASVDGTEFFWDTAAYAGAPVLAGDTPILSAGPVTGVGTGWTAPGWRTARSTETDPWATSGAAALGPSVAIGPSGGLAIDGLEWMGARVYDPAVRGFLSVDPFDSVVGTGWAGNPYSYAGNNPLHATDPAGLSPVTDSELAKYRSSNGIGGAWNAVNSWTKSNWEYIAGGAMVLGGAALMATGVGGPLGVMLVSAGANTIIQKATTGEVNWSEVAVSGAAGAVGFGVGGAVAKVAGEGIWATVAVGAASGAADGAVNGGGTYLVGPGPHTASGLVRSTATGAAIGELTGGAGGAAAHGIGSLARSAGHGLGPNPGRALGDIPAEPTGPIVDVPTPAPKPRFIVNSSGDVLDTTRVTIPEGKLGYLLKNQSKAGIFDESMGHTDNTLEPALREHLTSNFGNATPGVRMGGEPLPGFDQTGEKFVVTGPMTGPTGESWNMNTAWGADPDGTVRLITASPAK
ncbi:RHS repeat-associated core domain-containing protein [Microlunatus sagamiharensis]|uniref:RHS repeat-associated core domain-containing protein n=1 Tax=Microlunatus sagamiharensis TaxID=546874 RepID=A0A1H2LLC1_9ACTN|nr:DUF6531 domain-containing protein [Microlunatus sagamiharensis]SDU81186.1 RHS repeat-associated core domain-containing protein [Microlunatus sagamiharensis]